MNKLLKYTAIALTIFGIFVVYIINDKSLSLQEKEQISNAGTISSIVGLLISIIILQATENIFNARRRALIEKDFEKKEKSFILNTEIYF